MRFPGRSLSGSDMQRRRAVTVRTAPDYAQRAPSGHAGFVDIF